MINSFSSNKYVKKKENLAIAEDQSVTLMSLCKDCYFIQLSVNKHGFTQTISDTQQHGYTCWIYHRCSLFKL